MIDVRAPGEWEERRIDGSVNVPLSRLGERTHELPDDRPLVVLCASGYRSAIAAGVLAQAGFASVADLVGDLAAWESKRPEPPSPVI